MDMHTKEGKSYWRKRVKKEMEAKDKKDVSLGKSMKQIHDYHFREIEKEIESFYQRYADKEAIDLKLAKKAVSDVDINAYQKKAKELVARANEMRKEVIFLFGVNVGLRLELLDILVCLLIQTILFTVIMVITQLQ